MGNRYLEGNYAPVRREHTITELAVTGTIPAHLDGRYLRNGPNPVADPDPGTCHWFTGDGMVHGVRLREGRAHWYRQPPAAASLDMIAMIHLPGAGPVRVPRRLAARHSVN